MEQHCIAPMIHTNTSVTSMEAGSSHVVQTNVGLHIPTHFINQCIGKVTAALHYNNRDGVIHECILCIVFYQHKCIIATKCILFYYLHVYILEFIHVFACSLSLRCMPNSRVACGIEDFIPHNTHSFSRPTPLKPASVTHGLLRIS